MSIVLEIYQTCLALIVYVSRSERATFNLFNLLLIKIKDKRTNYYIDTNSLKENSVTNTASIVIFKMPSTGRY